MTGILDIIGRGDELSYQVSEAIMLLMRQGGALGELERREIIGADGTAREIKLFPQLWLRRLERAAGCGAFAKKPVEAIVEAILTTEAPADLLAQSGEAA